MQKLPFSLSGLKPQVYFEVYKEFISSSGVKQIAKSVNHFLYSQAHDSKPTKAMQFGTMIHDFILEDKEPVCLPDRNYRTKENKQFKENFLREYAERNIVDAEEFIAAYSMRKNVFDDKRAAKLLDMENGEVEKSFFWADCDYGYGLKAKADYISNNCEYIVDLKTTIDASTASLMKSIVNFSYDLSAAMYVDGVEAVTGIRPDFYIVAVEKSAPFNVNVVKFSDRDLENGREMYKRCLRRFKNYEQHGAVSGYGNTISETRLPPWASWEKRLGL